jgi:hypothetical protein
MGKASFSWETDPNIMADKIAGWKEKAIAGLRALFLVFGARLTSYAMEHAPWTDRTSNARQGLITGMEDSGTSLVLILAHSMDYGIYLETKYGGKWGTILDSIEAIYPQLMAAVSALLR